MCQLSLLLFLLSVFSPVHSEMSGVTSISYLDFVSTFGDLSKFITVLLLTEKFVDLYYLILKHTNTRTRTLLWRYSHFDIFRYLGFLVFLIFLFFLFSTIIQIFYLRPLLRQWLNDSSLSNLEISVCRYSSITKWGLSGSFFLSLPLWSISKTSSTPILFSDFSVPNPQLH